VLSVLWAGFSIMTFVALASSDLLNPMASMQRAQAGSPEQAIALMGKMVSTMLVILPVWIALFVLTLSAVMRMVLRPSERGTGVFRIGPDEARLTLVTLAVGGMIFAAYVGCMVIAFITGGIPVVVAAALLAALLLCCAIAIRYSLAAPETFATGRVSVAASVKLTSGRFPALLRAYGAVLLLNLVVSILGGLIMEAIGGIAGIKEPPTTLAQGLVPGYLLILALQGVFQALTLILTIAPTAYIYRSLTSTDVRL